MSASRTAASSPGFDLTAWMVEPMANRASSSSWPEAERVGLAVSGADPGPVVLDVERRVADGEQPRSQFEAVSGARPWGGRCAVLEFRQFLATARPAPAVNSDSRHVDAMLTHPVCRLRSSNALDGTRSSGDRDPRWVRGASASTCKNGSSLTRRRDKERDEVWKAAPSRETTHDYPHGKDEATRRVRKPRRMWPGKTRAPAKVSWIGTSVRQSWRRAVRSQVFCFRPAAATDRAGSSTARRTGRAAGSGTAGCGARTSPSRAARRAPPPARPAIATIARQPRGPASAAAAARAPAAATCNMTSSASGGTTRSRPSRQQVRRGPGQAPPAAAAARIAAGSAAGRAPSAGAAHAPRRRRRAARWSTWTCGAEQRRVAGAARTRCPSPGPRPGWRRGRGASRSTRQGKAMPLPVRWQGSPSRRSPRGRTRLRTSTASALITPLGVGRSGAASRYSRLHRAAGGRRLARRWCRCRRREMRQSASTMITTSGGSAARWSRPKTMAKPLPRRSGSWRSITSAPAARAAAAVPSLQLSAMTIRRSAGPAAGSRPMTVAAMPRLLVVRRHQHRHPGRRRPRPRPPAMASGSSDARHSPSKIAPGEATALPATAAPSPGGSCLWGTVRRQSTRRPETR